MDDAFARAGRYAPAAESDVTRLVEEHPLAWIVCTGPAAPLATLLPLRPVVENGAVRAFIGHFARRNPQVAALQASSRALVLLLGPHGYVSPSWLGDRTQAPTWNYASAQFVVDLRFFDPGRPTAPAMQDLVDTMERGRENAWSIPEMGARYAALEPRVIAFEATIVQRHLKFKLAQDERDAEYPEILAGLEAGGDHELAEWIRRANPKREGAR